MSCCPDSTNFDAPPLQLCPELRLSLGGDAALLPCTYDVWAAMNDPSLLDISDRQLQPCCFFLFQACSREVRILSVDPDLVRVLIMFRNGLSVEEVLQALECAAEKTAASASIEKLLMLGAPFFKPGAPEDRFRHATK